MTKNPAAVALGKIKTAKKADASRENGRLGGRPPHKPNPHQTKKEKNQMKTDIQYQILGNKIIGQVFDGETQVGQNIVIPITETEDENIRLGIITKNDIENWILDAPQ